MGRIGAVQVMRAIAANLVVLCHIAEIERKFSPDDVALPAICLEFGTLGVGLFFAISGFVIVQAARRETACQFLYARVTRIYPLYWIYTTILLLGYVVAAAQLSDRSDVSLWRSYLLWPADQHPLLVVGWTLVHEMYFYIVVAIMIAARVNLLAGLLVWGMAILAGNLLMTPVGPELTLALNPMTFLFIYGALLGLFVPAGGAMRQPSPKSFAEKLGDASYSTYLGHLLCIACIWRLAIALGIDAPPLLLAAVCLVASNLLGLVSYRFVEQPILRVARGLFARLTRADTPSRAAAQTI